MQLILVVDDEHGYAHILRLLLEAEGYRIVLAANGRQALQVLEGERPAVVLSDFMMPHMHGGEFGAALRADARLRDIPLVLASATAEEVVRREFRDYDVFLPKPYDVWALLSIIERLVREGRQAAVPRDPEVDASLRRLLRGVKLPPDMG